jgi:hypothetical protein
MGVPIFHGCYDRAQTGMHHHMGDKVVQDYGLSRKAASALQGFLKEEWVAAQQDAVNRIYIAQPASFVFLGCLRVLCGEKTTKTEVGGVRKYFTDGAFEPTHATISLIGRFKQRGGNIIFSQWQR